MNPRLKILGAAYGPANVTEKIRGQVKDHSLTVEANNYGTLFGDPWPGKPKSLVVIYQFGDNQHQVAAVKQDTTLNINYEPRSKYSPPAPGVLRILGAAYGLGDVTGKCQSLVTHNSALAVHVDTSTFGDPWPGATKILVVVYQYNNTFPMTISMQDNLLVIAYN